MNNDHQPPLPNIRDWTQPVEIRNGELGKLIVDAASAGWQATRLDVVPGGYRVHFQPIGENGKPPARREFTSFASFADRSQPPERDEE